MSALTPDLTGLTVERAAAPIGAYVPAGYISGRALPGPPPRDLRSFSQSTTVCGPPSDTPACTAASSLDSPRAIASRTADDAPGTRPRRPSASSWAALSSSAASRRSRWRCGWRRPRCPSRAASAARRRRCRCSRPRSRASRTVTKVRVLRRVKSVNDLRTRVSTSWPSHAATTPSRIVTARCARWRGRCRG